MSRNAESRFALNPTDVSLSRSKFTRNSSLKTSFNFGDVVPFYVDEVLPGDTFQIKTSKVVRLQTMLKPIMDNMYLDTYYFFVPNRLVWQHWQEFCGENTSSAWIPAVEYTIPQVEAPASTGWITGTLADYFGIPIGVPGLSVNALPFRAYAKIIDDWFRDQNLQDPVVVPVDDTTVTGVNTDNYITDLAKGGAPFIAAKYHDYFTSALPDPQKGDPISISITGNAPVYGNGNALALLGDGAGTFKYNYFYAGSNLDIVSRGSDSVKKAGDSISWPSGSEADKFAFGVATKDDVTDPDDTGLYADMSNLSAITVNALRLAFQMQKILERDARGGTRYISILKSHFGVTSPDARLQRSEYLGGNRIPININQVIQTSESGSGTPQGNVAGYSITTDTHGDFIKSFVEHGFVIGLMVARYNHTYQQGLERFWSRSTRYDYYWPELSNIGEQAILNKEIFAQGTSDDDEVFGYQEAWADYRYKPNRTSGEMRSTATLSLDSWHLGDYYESLPYLSPDWIHEDKSNVDRTIAITSDVANQLFADIYIQNTSTRAMPMYSIPGLIDHH